MQYILNKSTKVIVVPEGLTASLSKDHPYIGTTKYGDLWSRDCVVKDTSKVLDPRLHYNAELRVINKLEPDSPDYVVNALLAQDMATLDPMLAHYQGHITAGEDEAAARAEKQYLIARAEIKEKYGKGSSVFITETGGCYHTDEHCESLAGHEVKEVKLSVGLKDYTACTLCADTE